MSTLASPSSPPPPKPQPQTHLSFLHSNPHFTTLLQTQTQSQSQPPSYHSLLRSLSRSRTTNTSHLALLLFHSMLLDPSAPPPCRFTIPPALAAAAFLAAHPEGAQLHALATKLSLFPTNTIVSNSLAHLYSSCGRLASARKVVDAIPHKNRVSWNTVIDACVGNGDFDSALLLFRQMLQEGFEADTYTTQSVLGACAGTGALSLGMWAHALMIRTFRSVVADDVLINNSLVDLYAKCGSIEMARQVFERMPVKDLTSWNVMILGLSNHGRVRESVDMFVQMTEMEMMKPNAITFVGLLSACNHGGLVEEGKRYFDVMVRQYRIRPQIEHYGCMVDILARAGLIDEALDVVSQMDCRPDAIIWRSLLDACCKGNAGFELSEMMAKRALDMPDDGTSGVYVLLSRVYASAHRWNDVALVRRLMSEDGVMKEPGFSSVEMDNGMFHQFVAGDTSHPLSDEIYMKLQEIEERLVSVGYEPDLSQAPMVAGVDHVKGDSLRHHSERLAISFGLLTMSTGAPIRILKNLRVCKDCHTMTKLISKLYHVEIIVRDRIRFHHFKDGLCSCMDYW